jgi:hypothetical protein
MFELFTKNMSVKEMTSKYLLQESVTVDRISDSSHFPQLRLQLLGLVSDALQHSILHAILGYVFLGCLLTILPKLDIATLCNVMLDGKDRGVNTRIYRDAYRRKAYEQTD